MGKQLDLFSPPPKPPERPRNPFLEALLPDPRFGRKKRPPDTEQAVWTCPVCKSKVYEGHPRAPR